MKGISQKSYFYRVAEMTPTEFWINTALQEDLEYYLAQGAMGNTSNPTHIPIALSNDKNIWYPVIDGILKSNFELSNDEVASLVLQKITLRSLSMFEPLYKKSKGKYGYVAIQGNPFTNEDLELVIKEAEVFSKLGENVAVKIQSTESGIKAVEYLTSQGINTICTKGFSVAQGIAMAEAYERGLDKTDAAPACYVVNIAGILDDYLNEKIMELGMNIDSRYIRHAGVSMNRKLYKIFKKNNYRARLMFGGSRQPYHFTDLVGGDVAITISPSQAKPLINENPPVVKRIDVETPSNILNMLEEIPDFCKAYYEYELCPSEFKDFGPCVKFQKACEEGYKKTLNEIESRRKIVSL
ncbi:MAG: transaldolase family protein [Candidatus Bathyarchaeia archaeon]